MMEAFHHEQLPLDGVRKRNKKVAVVMICSPSRGTLEGAIHHGLRVAHCCREGRYQQPRGDQAGHDHQLRSAVSNLHWSIGIAPYRTDRSTRKSTKYIRSRTMSLAGSWHACLPHLWEHAQEKRIQNFQFSCGL